MFLKLFIFCSYGGGYDLASRRKNATRESTATLKQWLNEHKKNPYPTKGEKIMLAIITKMTLTQVSFTEDIFLITKPPKVLGRPWKLSIMTIPMKPLKLEVGFKSASIHFD